MPMEETTPMDEDRAKVADMSEKIRRGDYRIDPVAVADAILTRLRDVAAARAEHVASGERVSAADALLTLNARSPIARPASR
jgi:Anti-sigma-28 factor, FlgM